MNSKQTELLKELWYSRNPVHESNTNTGEDMFWGTVLCVIDDYNTASLPSKPVGDVEEKFKDANYEQMWREMVNINMKLNDELMRLSSHNVAIIKDLKETREQLSGYAAAPQKGMKWVKASERMPEDLKRNYIVRQMGNSRSVRSVWWEHIHGNVEGSLKLPLYHIEWLDEPYFVWCDVEGCEEEGCSGGNSWRATGYWVVCYKHSQDHRDGKPQPKMKQKAIDRETTRGAEGKLMRGE